MRILVLGGSGFIGRHVVGALRGRGHAVLIGTRRPRAPHPCPAREAHLEALGNPDSWTELLSGVDAVVNAVGILRERRHATYERVHHLAAGALARACAAVAASGADYCILRPSLLDGDGGFGARWLRWLAGWPVHLVPGDAAGRIAALRVDDLGEAIARLCEMRLPEAEVGGLAAYTISEYLDALRAAKGRPPAIRLRVPGWLARAASHVFDLLHFSPFSFGALGAHAAR